MTLEEYEQIIAGATPDMFVINDLSEIGGSKYDVEVWADTGLTVAKFVNPFGYEGQALKNAYFCAHSRQAIPRLISVMKEMAEAIKITEQSVNARFIDRKDADAAFRGAKRKRAKALASYENLVKDVLNG